MGRISEVGLRMERTREVKEERMMREVLVEALADA